MYNLLFMSNLQNDLHLPPIPLGTLFLGSEKSIENNSPKKETKLTQHKKKDKPTNDQKIESILSRHDSIFAKSESLFIKHHPPILKNPMNSKQQNEEKQNSMHNPQMPAKIYPENSQNLKEEESKCQKCKECVLNVCVCIDNNLNRITDSVIRSRMERSQVKTTLNPNAKFFPILITILIL